MAGTLQRGRSRNHESSSLGYALWPELGDALHGKGSSLAAWDMRCGRNLIAPALNDTLSLAAWDMRCGRNTFAFAGFFLGSLAAWDMRCGRNIVTGLHGDSKV